MVDILFKPVCLNTEATLKVALQNQLNTQTHVFLIGTQEYYLAPLPSNSLYKMVQLYFSFIMQETIITFIDLHVCICVLSCVCHNMYMEAKGKLGVSSLLSCGSWDSNSNCQVWAQVILPHRSIARQPFKTGLFIF